MRPEPMTTGRIVALVDSVRDQFLDPEPTLENIRALQGVITRVGALLDPVPPVEAGDSLGNGGGPA